MKSVIGYLKNISQKCYAKDKNGNLREIYPGDPIYLGEIIVDKNGNILEGVIKRLKYPLQIKEIIYEEDNIDKLHHKKPTEYNDILEDNYAEVDINAPLRDADFFIEYTGFYREGGKQRGSGEGS